MNENELNAKRVQLKWTNFQEEVASSFEDLFNQEDFADVTLGCDGRYLKAHKIILSSCSPYFHKLLKDNPCQHPIIIIQDVKFEILQSLLWFIYKGEVEVDQALLPKLIQVADTFKIKGLSTNIQKADFHKLPSHFQNYTPSASSENKTFVPEPPKYTYDRKIMEISYEKTDGITNDTPQYTSNDLTIQDQVFEDIIMTKKEPEEIEIDDDDIDSNQALIHQVEKFEDSTPFEINSDPGDESMYSQAMVHNDESFLRNVPTRRKASYTWEQKRVAIKRIKMGATKISVSRDLGIPESTLRGWIKSETGRKTHRVSQLESGAR